MARTTLVLVVAALAILACSATPPPTVSRLDAIPADAVKGHPNNDPWPPVVAAGWNQPLPLSAVINTAGAEDSPFVTPDGQALYFFFTPDLRVPPEKQLLDGVSGIWLTRRAGDGWTEPERVPLAGSADVHLDGCPFVLDDQMVFCSARPGNRREVDLYTATWQDGAWAEPQNWSDPINGAYDVGEMHITADGGSLYFASPRPGGFGGQDLWVSHKVDGRWGEPVNLGPAINTPGDENRPFVSLGGGELWFDAASHHGRAGPAIFRAIRQADGSWGEPEEIVSSFAGEPVLTADGRSLYFVHHYASADLAHIVEADIYVSTRLDE